MLLSPSAMAFSLSKVDLRSDELLAGGGITAKEDGVSIQLSKDYENSHNHMELCNLTSFSPDKVEACRAVHVKILT